MISALAAIGCLATAAPAGADSALYPDSGMSLVFANGTAHETAGNVAVPVQCFGSNRGFCSGVVTLSRRGHSISIPFSVRGGGHELLFVPLRLSGRADHPRKVHGVATTDQDLGPATTAKQYLYAR